uniref:RING-type E3 ubiquitin transferase (cysteine targeting) n=1 Tax=Rhizophora mucronata TaxID=61149 RepID=A0A2P2KX28_RHIMU
MLFQYEPELDAFLEFLIWRFSIWVDKPTPGNVLMNLRYRDDRAVLPRGKGRQVCTFLACAVAVELSLRCI